jgi:hypothetical protein
MAGYDPNQPRGGGPHKGEWTAGIVGAEMRARDFFGDSSKILENPSPLRLQTMFDNMFGDKVLRYVINGNDVGYGPAYRLIHADILKSMLGRPINLADTNKATKGWMFEADLKQIVAQRLDLRQWERDNSVGWMTPDRLAEREGAPVRANQTKIYR